MDLYHYSDPGQSQSSETLNELIENEKKRVKTAVNTQNSNKSSSSASTQTSSASFPPTASSAPPYNLYGLAAKEDETQSCEEEEEKLEEGSQKENIGAPRPKNDNGRINQALQNHLSRTPATPGPSSPMKSRKKDNGNELYVVSNQGSGKKATMTPHKPIPSSRYKPRPRPRSASQDSFAQDPSEDLQRKLLLQPEQLPLPLDQLSKRPHIDTGNSTSGTPRANMHFGRRIQQSPHMGRILVASTPSQSNSEASQDDLQIPDARQLSEQLEATQLVETQPADDPMNVDQEGYQSSEPSSSYGALLDGERELEPTQPTTEGDLQSGPPPTSFFPSLGVGTTTSSVPRTTGPRSLLTTVRPENQWRYAHIQPATPGIKRQPQQVQPAVPRAHTFAETQPSNDEYLAPDPAPLANVRGVHSRPQRFQNLAPPQEHSRLPPPHRASSPPLDSMDVVPDSEPSRSNEPVKQSTPVFKKLDTPKARSPAMRVDLEPVAPQGHEKEGSEAEESDEDDTPLAMTTATKRKAPPAKVAKSAATKSKGKDKMKDVTQADPTPRGTRAAKSKTQPARNKSSYEYAVIPSSMPEQDFSNKPRTRKAPSAKATPVPDENGDDEDGSDQEETAVDEEIVDEPGPSKKRKRAATKPAPSSNPKRQKKASKPTPAPTRASRRTAYLSQQGVYTPTRVFALSKLRGYYEIATVYSLVRSGINYADTYTVRFAKGDEAVISAHNMRQAILRKGDEVIPPGHQRSFRVAEDMSETAHSVDVDMNGERQSFKLSDLKLACASIRCRWDDRMINEIELVFKVGPGKLKSSATPTPNNKSESTAGSCKWPLHRTALMVTLNSNDAEYYAKQKSEIVEKVANGGGQVIDDFTTVLQMEGNLSNGGQCWIIKRDDVKWIGDGIDRLFLVADECNHKPKFLLALALGIPCLSLSWLWDIVENEQTEWAPYLLPQGFSAHLGCRASQRVDLEWGTTIQHTRDIMNNSVAPKVFAGMNILCVGGDVVPQPNTVKKIQDTGNALPRIMLAMGAAQVEAVASTQYASRPLSEYTYIVAHKPKDRTPDMPQEKIVEWTWVKDCLMASCLVPLDGQVKKQNA